MTGPAQRPRRWFTAAALVAVGAAALTLRSDLAHAGSIDLTAWTCIACGPAGGADLLQNLLLFLPIGIALARAGVGAWLVGGLCLTFSLGIELSQAYLLVGRDAALGDVLANTLGGAAGWGLGRHWRAWLLPAPDRGGRFAAGILALFLGQLALAGWLAVPTTDATGTVRITPAVPGRPVYGGSVVQFGLGGQTEYRGARPTVGASTPSNALEAVFTWEGGASTALTPILRIDDPRGWAIAAIDRRAGGIGIELRNRGHHLRLRPQTWLIGVPEGISTGDTLRLSLQMGGGWLRGTLGAPSGNSTIDLRYGAQHGWTLVNPFSPSHAPGESWLRWTLAWLVGWGVLLGWWAAATARPPAWGAAAIVGCLVVTAAWQARASIPEVLALAVGWLVAALSSGRCRRSVPGS